MKPTSAQTAAADKARAERNKARAEALDTYNREITQIEHRYTTTLKQIGTQ